MKLKLPLLLLLAAAMALLTPHVARADLGYWSAALVGTWKHPATGDLYRFNSDATYTLINAKPTSEAVAGSSGYWKIVQPTPKESSGSQEGPVALLIKQRVIRFKEDDGRQYTRNLKMEYRLVVNTVIVDGAEKKNLYTIDRAQWKRVK